MESSKRISTRGRRVDKWYKRAKGDWRIGRKKLKYQFQTLPPIMSQLIKYSIEHYRKEGVSEEELEKFFEEVHLPVALRLMKKYGFAKYAVQRRNIELGASFELMLQAVNPAWTVSKADMVISYWVPDMSCLGQMVADPDWHGKAVKGQENYIDMSRGLAHISHEITYLDGGEILKV